MHETKGTVEIDKLGDTKVFQPIKLGNNTLTHRVVFAPSSRMRSLEDHTPTDFLVKHYSDRSQTPGSLVIAEGTQISPKWGMFRNSPGIWNDEQVEAWKKVTAAVHKNKSFIGCQLFASGRAGDYGHSKELGYDLVAPSAVFPDEATKKGCEEAGIELRSLTTEEVEEIKKDFVVAAKNALAANFDYIEIHGGNGYLIDQFMQSSTNQRTDKYGGSVENRGRFMLDIVDEVSKVAKPEQLGVRLSPYMDFGGMKGAKDPIHPYITFGYIAHQLQLRADEGKELAYVSLVEPRFSTAVHTGQAESNSSKDSNQFILDLWRGTVIRAGNYTYGAPKLEGMINDVEDDRTLIAISRFFTSNPDLPYRLKNGFPLTPYDRPTFYTPRINYGYNTFPNYGETIEVDEEKEMLNLSQLMI